VRCRYGQWSDYLCEPIGLPLRLKLDNAKQSQNCGPEAGAQQYSRNGPARSTVRTLRRFCQLRTIIAERAGGVFPCAGKLGSSGSRRTVHIGILVHFNRPVNQSLKRVPRGCASRDNEPCRSVRTHSFVQPSKLQPAQTGCTWRPRHHTIGEARYGPIYRHVRQTAAGATWNVQATWDVQRCGWWTGAGPAAPTQY
jgi:hypothetical protein